jgi:hypothetical protein
MWEKRWRRHILLSHIVRPISLIEPDVSGSGLHFTFPLPQLVSRNDLYAFGQWLASSGCYTGMTLH